MNFQFFNNKEIYKVEFVEDQYKEVKIKIQGKI